MRRKTTIAIIIALSMALSMHTAVPSRADYGTYNPDNCQDFCRCISQCICGEKIADDLMAVYDINNRDLYNALKGKIIIRVHSRGEAYYVGTNGKIYRLGDMYSAYRTFASLARPLSNYNLEKIPVGLLPRTGIDSDRDGLSDVLEDALFTNRYNFNTDGDTWSDYTEVINHYNPRDAGRPPFDYSFVEKHKGKIFMQVESRGELWYLSPNYNQRYYIGDQFDAFNMIKHLGTGISEYNFYKLVK